MIPPALARFAPPPQAVMTPLESIAANAAAVFAMETMFVRPPGAVAPYSASPQQTTPEVLNAQNALSLENRAVMSIKPEGATLPYPPLPHATTFPACEASLSKYMAAKALSVDATAMTPVTAAGKPATWKPHEYTEPSVRTAVNAYLVLNIFSTLARGPTVPPHVSYPQAFTVPSTSKAQKAPSVEYTSRALRIGGCGLAPPSPRLPHAVTFPPSCKAAKALLVLLIYLMGPEDGRSRGTRPGSISPSEPPHCTKCVLLTPTKAVLCAYIAWRPCGL